jgi:low affinity iron permease
VAVRGEELAVALSTTPDSTSSNAWPARPCQARPHHSLRPTLLRALYCTPRGVRSRAYLRPLNLPPAGGLVYVIENGSKLEIGPILMQNAQNRESKAIHLKLDELIYAAKNARNELINIEHLTEEQLDRLGRRYSRISEHYQNQKSLIVGVGEASPGGSQVEGISDRSELILFK